MPSLTAFVALASRFAWVVPRRGWSQLRSRGQGMIEYALVIALIALVVVSALALLGPAINSSVGSVIHTIHRGLEPHSTTPSTQK